MCIMYICIHIFSFILVCNVISNKQNGCNMEGQMTWNYEYLNGGHST